MKKRLSLIIAAILCFLCAMAAVMTVSADTADSTDKIGTMTEGMQFKFGLMDITCPNVKCRHHVNSIEVDLETILFHKYQQAMNTNID